MGIAAKIVEEQLETLALVTEGLKPYEGYIRKHGIFTALHASDQKIGERSARPSSDVNRARVHEWRAANYERWREIAGRSARKHPESGVRRERRRTARKASAPIERIDEQRVFDECSGACGLCGKALLFWRRTGPDGWHLGHIISLAKGGAHTYGNVQALCRRCNLRKGAK